MKMVYSAASLAEAELIRGFLEGEGIIAIVQGTALWGGRGELPLTPDTAPSVWVGNDEDHDLARRLIEARVRAKPDHCGRCGYDLRGLTESRCPECGQPFSAPESWVCPTCGETIEGQFTSCWKCARSDETS